MTTKRWWRRAALWAVVMAAVATLSMVGLTRRANPWHVVLTIPGGYDESDYRHMDSGSADSAAISPDGRTLATGRPNGQVEFWDLQTLSRTATVGKAVPSEGTHPATEGAFWVRWFAASRRVVYHLYAESGIHLAGLDGERRSLSGEGDLCSPAAPAPSGDRVAVNDTDTVDVISIETGKAERHWDLDFVNGGRRRLEWTPDGRYLLLNDALAVRVFDVTTGRLVFMHRELDLHLPFPNFAGEGQGVQAPRTQPASGPALLDLDSYQGLVTCPRDSRLVDDGQAVLTIYGRFAAIRSPEDSPVCRARLYETATGKLLWDRQLPQEPRGMSISPDGRRAAIADCDSEVTDHVYLVDVSDGRTLYEFARDLVADHPVKTACLDERWIVAYSDAVWLLDTEKQCSPLRLDRPGMATVGVVAATPDGKTIARVGVDKTVRIYRPTRPMSRAGLWALPKMWVLYAACVLLFVGVVVIAGWSTGRQRRPLPVVVWGIVLLTALEVGWSLAGDLAEFVSGPIYDPDYWPGGVGFSDIVYWGLRLLLVAALVGTARLCMGWRRVLIGYMALSAVVLLLLTLVTLVAPAGDVLERQWHGWPYAVSVGQIRWLLAGGGVLSLVEMILLVLPTVRRRFRPDEPTTEAAASAAADDTIPPSGDGRKGRVR